MYPVGTHAGTWTSAVLVTGLENNRLKAHHFALSGKFFRQHPYKLMLTYSANHGTYGKPYAGESAWNKEWGSVVETPLRQLSAGLTGSVRLPALRRQAASAGLSSSGRRVAGPSASGRASAPTGSYAAESALSASSGRSAGPSASGRRAAELSLLYGLYADRGSVLPDTFGATLGARLSF